MTKHKIKGIRRFRNGWQIDIVDSKGERIRPSFATKAEAIAERKRIEAEKSNTGFGFFASSTKKTFSQLLDELVPFKRDIGGVQKDSLDGTQSIINANLKKAPFANWKLREFMDAGRWKVVQDWLVNELTEHGRAVFPASAGTGLGTDFGTGLAREPFLCSSHGVIGATFLAKRSASASERQARALIWNCP